MNFSRIYCSLIMSVSMTSACLDLGDLFGSLGDVITNLTDVIIFINNIK